MKSLIFSLPATRVRKIPLRYWPGIFIGHVIYRITAVLYGTVKYIPGPRYNGSKKKAF